MSAEEDSGSDARREDATSAETRPRRHAVRLAPSRAVTNTTATVSPAGSAGSSAGAAEARTGARSDGARAHASARTSARAARGTGRRPEDAARRVWGGGGDASARGTTIRGDPSEARAEEREARADEREARAASRSSRGTGIAAARGRAVGRRREPPGRGATLTTTTRSRDSARRTLCARTASIIFPRRPAGASFVPWDSFDDRSRAARTARPRALPGHARWRSSAR